MASLLPRVLFLTREIPQGANAGSQQLLRALQSYPAEKLQVIGPAPVAGAELLDCSYHAYPLPVTRWINSRFHEWVNLVNAVGLIPRPRARWLRETIERFDPQLIVTVMDCMSYYLIAGAAAREARVPLCTITMDRPDTFERVPRRYRGWQFRRLRQLYQQASRNLAVSRQMARWINRVFTAPAHPYYFAPSPDIPRGDPERCRTPRTPGKFVIGYAGSLEFGYERQIAALLPEMAAQQMTLRVYSAHQDRLPASPALDARSFRPVRDLWRELIEECDALLLPYPFDHAQAPLYRTHFPTKLSEYYSLRLPVLMLGPRYATGIRWGLDHPGSALVVTENNPERWREALAELRSNSAGRVNWARRAGELAQEFFDPAQAQEAFQQVLVQAAHPPRPGTATS